MSEPVRLVNGSFKAMVGIPENEVLMSFENDSGAFYFYDWWHSQGKNSFDTYVAKEERKRNATV